MENNINFGDIQIEYPVVSQALGYYKKTKFTFDDASFEDLLNELLMWEKEEEALQN